jgi:hypothetical protein
MMWIYDWGRAKATEGGTSKGDKKTPETGFLAYRLRLFDIVNHIAGYEARFSDL